MAKVVSISPGTPPWPSLYRLGLEISGEFQHHDATQPGGQYLYDSSDIFLYTLYWSFVLYVPLFFLCGTFAFFNLAFAPTPRPAPHTRHRTRQPKEAPAHQTRRENARRSRFTFALLVLLAFFALGLAGAFVGSAIGGYAIAGLFRAAKFNMSTWFPFLWVAIWVLIGLLGLWPTIINII